MNAFLHAMTRLRGADALVRGCLADASPAKKFGERGRSPDNRGRGRSRHAAAAALLFFGAQFFLHAEDAVPAVEKLAQQLAASEAGARRDAAFQLGKIGPGAKAALPALVKALQDSDKQVWSFSIAAITALGPEAKDAIPALLDGLNSRTGRDRDRRQGMVRYAYALTRIGPEAIPPLIKALSADDSGLRAGAARALGGMGPGAKEAIPALRENFGHGEASVRQEATDALALIGADAVAPVSEALGWNEPLQRASAALTLAQLGAAASSAEPALLQMLAKETDASARAAALTALPKISADPLKAGPLLVAAVKDDSEPVRHAAINAIAATRALRRPAVPLLAALLTDANPAVRQRGAHALGRLGPDAADALPALIDGARAANGDAAFGDALAQIGPAALPTLLAALKQSNAASGAWILRTLRSFGPPAVPVLIEALKQPEPAQRAAAASALGAMGRAAADAIKPLFTLATASDAPVQAAALRALVALQAPPAQLKPLLQTALASPVPELRKTGAAGLAALGGAASLGVDGLRELLADDDAAGRLAAVRAFGELAAEAAPAVPDLIARLGDAPLQSAAMEALGKIGAPAAPAVPRLLEIAQNSANDVRATALTTFAGIGHAAAPALPMIYAALRDPSPELRVPAVPALSRVESDDAKIIAALTTALSDEIGRVRRPAAQALAQYGEKVRPAVPAIVAMVEREIDRVVALDALRAIGVRTVPDLLKILAVKDPNVRIFACESLTALGPEAKDAAAPLRELTNGQPAPVQDAARAALAKIEPAPAP